MKKKKTTDFSLHYNDDHDEVDDERGTSRSMDVVISQQEI